MCGIFACIHCLCQPFDSALKVCVCKHNNDHHSHIILLHMHSHTHTVIYTHFSLARMYTHTHTHTHTHKHTHTQAQVVEKLRRRGPDYIGEATVPIGDHGTQLDMIGTLLHMRGAEPTPQPLRGNGENLSASTGDRKTSVGGNILLWNGNIFGGEIEARHSTHLCHIYILYAQMHIHM